MGFTCFGLVLLFLKLQKSRETDAKRSIKEHILDLDPLGGILIIASICCLLLALQWAGTTKAWDSPTIIGLFIGFGLLLAAFACTQAYVGDQATIPIRVLKQRSVLAGSLFLFFLQMTNFTVSLH